MKKIKKLDSKTAQSVLAFACPCVGSCTYCACGCYGGSTSVTNSSYNGSYNAVGTVGQAGTTSPTY